MSFKKGDPSFPTHEWTKIDRNFRRKITTEIMAALRQEYENGSSPNKKIANKTNTATRAAKNWFSGRNTPDSCHLIRLMEHSDAVLATLLRLAKRDQLIPHIAGPKNDNFLGQKERSAATPGMADGIKNVPINVPIKILNRRQNWFLDELSCNIRVSANDIARHWQVTLKTAKRDIAGLKHKGLIIFRGSKKAGWYEIIDR